jgi:ParB-like chromosome segregation protein Spo0J
MRVDVHPYEEAEGFQRLLDIPGYDVATLVEKSGKSASHIYARLALLQLIPEVADAFTQERITVSHANLIARIPHSGQQYPMAEAFEQEITTLYEAREQEHEARRLESSLSPRRGPRLSNLSLERFRSSTKYQDRPAAADIAFCVAAFANGMTEDRIGCALEDDYLSRDPSPTKRAAYIRRTMEKARRWAER